ncbi:inactive dipeptidyl peptidase 10 [Pelobates cultripes]|uniref:Inactive dipeptidyl peptidase 10 n=1 Tax=Pelobates cultripes TaxID=61616 RepID=A0AAD1SN23_PELCU|nr:inactive dipeptidyl peptidase 10 [Pelobates cultripes]
MCSGQRQKGRGQKLKWRISTPTPQTPTDSEPEAMQVDLIRGPLSNEEKQWRRTHNLCLYCGSAGHYAINCPSKSKRTIAMTAEGAQIQHQCQISDQLDSVTQPLFSLAQGEEAIQRRDITYDLIAIQRRDITYDLIAIHWRDITYDLIAIQRRDITYDLIAIQRRDITYDLIAIQRRDITYDLIAIQRCDITYDLIAIQRRDITCDLIAIQRRDITYDLLAIQRRDITCDLIAIIGVISCMILALIPGLWCNSRRDITCDLIAIQRRDITYDLIAIQRRDITCDLIAIQRRDITYDLIAIQRRDITYDLIAIQRRDITCDLIAIQRRDITYDLITIQRQEIPNSSGSSLTLEDLFRKEFSIYDPEPKWIQDHELVYKDREGYVFRLNVETKEAKTLLENSTFVTFKASRYSVSPDLRYVLLAYDVKQVFHWSFTASYVICDIQTREVWELNPPEVEDSVLQYAEWGATGQQLIYIFENNIYYQREVKGSSLRLTSSGKDGIIYNGIADWLYEEHILQNTLCHWSGVVPEDWKPGDHAKLILLIFLIGFHGKVLMGENTGKLFRWNFNISHSMLGATGPSIPLFLCSLYPLPLTSSSSSSSSSSYTRDTAAPPWTTVTPTAVHPLEPYQNLHMETLNIPHRRKSACYTPINTKYEIISDVWLSKQNEEPVFSKDGSKFFLTVPVKQGGRGEFHHIAMFSVQAKTDIVSVRHLTSGSWEVIKILAYDEPSQKLTFQNCRSSSRGRKARNVSIFGLLNRHCLSCGFAMDQCSYFNAKFSPFNHHFLLHCKGPGVPSVSVHSTNNPSDFFTIENNSVLKEAISQKKIFKSEIKMIQIEDYELPLRLSFPKDFTEKNRYPLLLIISGQPL